MVPITTFNFLLGIYFATTVYIFCKLIEFSTKSFQYKYHTQSDKSYCIIKKSRLWLLELACRYIRFSKMIYMSFYQLVSKIWHNVFELDSRKKVMGLNINYLTRSPRNLFFCYLLRTAA